MLNRELETEQILCLTVLIVAIFACIFEQWQIVRDVILATFSAITGGTAALKLQARRQAREIDTRIAGMPAGSDAS